MAKLSIAEYSAITHTGGGAHWWSCPFPCTPPIAERVVDVPGLSEPFHAETRFVRLVGDAPVHIAFGIAALEEIAGLVAKELGIAPPSIRMFRLAKSSEDHDLALNDCSACYGWPGIVYIKSGLSRRETLVCLGHELHHHWSNRTGREMDEVEAEAFGEEVAERY